jgi:hypothetical protein
LVLASTASAHAGPAVTLAVAGDCPSDAQVREALAPWFAITADAEWRISVDDRRGSATLELRDRTGVVLSRALASTDCAAVADAFAVMIHGHFVELHLLPPADAPVTEPAAPVAVPPAAAPAVVAMIDTSMPASPPPTELDTGARPTARVAPAPLRLAVSGGVALSGDEIEPSGFGQLDVAWEPRPGWLVRAAIGADAPNTIGAMPDRVEVFRSIAKVGAGRRVRAGAGWLVPAVDAGVAIWRVEPLDLRDNNTDPTGTGGARWRVQPVADASLAYALPLSGRLALRVEVVGTLFVLRHRYVVEPDGEIGRSPRAALAVGAGLEWRIR